MKDLDLPEEFSNVEIRDHRCKDPNEKLYIILQNLTQYAYTADKINLTL